MIFSQPGFPRDCLYPWNEEAAWRCPPETIFHHCNSFSSCFYRSWIRPHLPHSGAIYLRTLQGQKSLIVALQRQLSLNVTLIGKDRLYSPEYLMVTLQGLNLSSSLPRGSISTHCSHCPLFSSTDGICHCHPFPFRTEKQLSDWIFHPSESTQFFLL